MYEDLVKRLQDFAAEIRRAEDVLLLLEAANVDVTHWMPLPEPPAEPPMEGE